MQIQIKHSPAFASATCTLAPNEQVKAESGAMIFKTPSVNIDTSTQGGFMKGLKRSFGGESFFMNTFTAGPEGGETGRFRVARAGRGWNSRRERRPGGWLRPPRWLWSSASALSTVER